ncbi:MAG: deoxyguanosinetriphosphate triphosphohydrolase [Deltaproteobacteria bacterium]|jgi:dGTPase|nr:deoxyguanosinetriphosphate triphosphohydrolase [Deltaproteobacteria bacterium]MBW2652442.1 deoxyguanosinetriphosphate triphosphohydrolase [Deltaproteobacteria bacterium]
MNSLERPDLAPYAAKSNLSKGRKYKEDFKDDRPAFERDRDRIIHSSAFRRLEYKTQVFVNHEGDYYRTRLTHSLEVAQIAKGIARRLKLNEELTESLALAHDLGHTPFGHSGEKALNRMMEGMGGFEHNLQSLRVVEVLEDKYPGFQGLNLTWETREGIAKHSSSCDNPSYAHLKEYNPETVPTLEAQIINLADEIAYNNHDIDDALEAGFTSFEELRGVGLCEKMMLKVEKQFSGISEQKKKYQTISTLIGYLINDVVRYSLENIKQNRIEAFEDVKAVNRILVSYSKQADEQTAELKAFLQKNVYQHYKVERMRVKAERYVTLLFSTFKDNPTLLPQKYRERIEIESKERVICDYIAGMTDRYALDEYKKLFEPYERV